MSEKSIVFYHANCADGFGAAFAAWLKLGDSAEYLPMEYGRSIGANLPMFEGREVYILDFSFPKQDMDDIFAEAKRVVWLDHHKTAFEMWCGSWAPKMKFSKTDGCYIELDDERSGALLAWEYFHPGTDVPIFVKHIDDRDRWQFKLEGTKVFSAALFSYQPWTFEKWCSLFGDQPKLPKWASPEQLDGVLYNEGAAILRAHNSNVRAVLKQARPCNIRVLLDKDGFAPVLNGLAANAPAFLASDLGHELANQSGTFGLCWSLDAENVVRCSLRSNGNYDVSAIAGAFGGGGHRNAAGFSTDIGTLMGWLT